MDKYIAITTNDFRIMVAKRSEMPPWSYSEVETFPLGLNIGTLLAALNKAAEDDGGKAEKAYQARISNFISKPNPEEDVRRVDERMFARIKEIDEMFESATSWGSWMAEASAERGSLVNELRRVGYTEVEHKHKFLKGAI